MFSAKNSKGQEPANADVLCDQDNFCIGWKPAEADIRNVKKETEIWSRQIRIACLNIFY